MNVREPSSRDPNERRPTPPRRVQIDKTGGVELSLGHPGIQLGLATVLRDSLEKLDFDDVRARVKVHIEVNGIPRHQMAFAGGWLSEIDEMAHRRDFKGASDLLDSVEEVLQKDIQEHPSELAFGPSTKSKIAQRKYFDTERFLATEVDRINAVLDWLDRRDLLGRGATDGALSALVRIMNMNPDSYRDLSCWPRRAMNKIAIDSDPIEASMYLRSVRTDFERRLTAAAKRHDEEPLSASRRGS